MLALVPMLVLVLELEPTVLIKWLASPFLVGVCSTGVDAVLSTIENTIGVVPTTELLDNSPGIVDGVVVNPLLISTLTVVVADVGDAGAIDSDGVASVAR